PLSGSPAHLPTRISPSGSLEEQSRRDPAPWAGDSRHVPPRRGALSDRGTSLPLSPDDGADHRNANSREPHLRPTSRPAAAQRTAARPFSSWLIRHLRSGTLSAGKPLFPRIHDVMCLRFQHLIKFLRLRIHCVHHLPDRVQLAIKQPLDLLYVDRIGGVDGETQTRGGHLCAWKAGDYARSITEESRIAGERNIKRELPRRCLHLPAELHNVQRRLARPFTSDPIAELRCLRAIERHALVHEPIHKVHRFACFDLAQEIVVALF